MHLFSVYTTYITYIHTAAFTVYMWNSMFMSFPLV